MHICKLVHICKPASCCLTVITSHRKTQGNRTSLSFFSYKLFFKDENYESINTRLRNHCLRNHCLRNHCLKNHCLRIHCLRIHCLRIHCFRIHLSFHKHKQMHKLLLMYKLATFSLLLKTQMPLMFNTQCSTLMFNILYINLTRGAFIPFSSC